ncbi:MRS-1 protein [Thecamonas trahens ATCC 50062]|uniref:methionine--tRNA ligase n=1 Tax=Thecamonas trahens ATCC 50062 TaxID=461836 RepID=A0A0L0DFK6_THETB|nr:MRS-1 protein [Thecamonas trahens ATCC 50062]KNC51102.1 MRS-1 protein [Thecamonas trahens ATCC 50062]|eukprot:XP_013756310.1 MRS-1 protein [Thecamonas trahens ATCC 50062]
MAQFIPSLRDSPVTEPDAAKRNILVTSALPYCNNVPHLGNIVGCVLGADVYARFCRARGYNTLYVCGTDEYGTATENKAREEGVSPKEICDKYHAIHAQVYEWFNIKFDTFGRTSTPKQTEIAQDIFNKLHSAGLTLEQEVTQLYCEACAKFLADRFVEGTCPKCGYNNARGDQCDGCSSLLDPTDLVEPKCKVCSKTPKPRSSQHVFLDLPKIEPDLRAWLESEPQKNGWPDNAISTSLGFLNRGLQPRCITRDLSWGTPVPLPGYENKVFYVWFDAPIGYISITGNYLPETWEAWWKAPKSDDAPQVELRQFMGKDNVTFHAIIFPSTLLGCAQAGDKYNLVHHLASVNYLQYEDSKFSKSRGTGVFGDNVQTTGIPPAVWRYYLMALRPERSDSAFVWDEFVARNNNELAANLGNYVNRVLKFAKAKFDGVVPASGPPTELETTFEAEVNARLAEYLEAMEQSQLRAGLAAAMALSSLGNKYLHDGAPWAVIKTDPARAGAIIANAANYIYFLAAVFAPFLPSISSRMLHQLGLVDNPTPDLADELHPVIPDAYALADAVLPAGHVFGVPEVLFANIPEDRIAELRAQFSGKQADDAAPSGDAAGASASAAAGGVAVDAARLADAIATQGGVVRSLKEASDGSDEAKAKVSAAVKVLLYLKNLHAQVTGDDGKSKKKGKGKGDKKAGKAGKKKGGKVSRAPQDPNACPLDLAIGTVVSCVPHPDSDKLLVMKVDIGEADGPRDICAGLAKSYAPDQLIGRSFVVLANIKAAKLGGFPSDGMMLAAAAADPDAPADAPSEIVALLVADGDAAPGSRVLGAGQVPRVLEGYAKLRKKAVSKVKMATAADGGVLIDGLALATIDGVRIVPDPTVNGIGPDVPVC